MMPSAEDAITIIIYEYHRKDQASTFGPTNTEVACSTGITHTYKIQRGLDAHDINAFNLPRMTHHSFRPSLTIISSTT